MIVTLIGKKRAIFLALALAANALVASAYILVVEPMKLEEENSLRNVSSQISKLSVDIENIKRELREFPVNHARYQALEAKGFFSVQDRFEAGRVIDSLRPRSGLLGYTYRIEALRQMQDAKAAAANASLIASRVSIDGMTSVLDANVFSFMRAIGDTFPQHTRINSFEIKRDKEVDTALLKSIAAAPVPVVSAKVDFDWLTVVPQDALPVEGQPGGFRGR